MLYESSFTKEYGPRIRAVRKAQDLSLSDLAQMTGISTSYLSHIETGKVDNPSIAAINKIAQGLGITLPELLERIGLGQGMEEEIWKDISTLSKAGEKDKAKLRYALRFSEGKLTDETISLEERKKFARIMVSLTEAFF